MEENSYLSMADIEALAATFEAADLRDGETPAPEVEEADD